MVKKNQEITVNNYQERAKNLLDVIMAYAMLDFKPKAYISNDADVFDALSAGVNMLGEELKNSTVSLKEKEFLLKEIHHRVKNNLQIINSLLSLQADYVSTQSELNALNESRNRIKSMSIVHEMLYTGNNISNINLREYVENLVGQLSFSYNASMDGIKVDIDINHRISFDIDTMIPLGLIINEVVSNSFKYAFPDKKGQIFIKYTCENNQCIITIGDNGIGYNGNILDDEKTKFGIMLIKILAEQLSANLIAETNNGIVYTLIYCDKNVSQQ